MQILQKTWLFCCLLLCSFHANAQVVASITVQGQGGVDTVQSGTILQMVETVLPTNAANPTVTWSVTNGTGSATINATTGVLMGGNQGTVTVCATATDGSGVQGCTTIFVKGILNCINLTVFLDASGITLISPAQMNNNSVGFVNYSINGQPFLSLTCANIGQNMVYLIGTDSMGNSDTCLATITVLDTIPPVSVCANITVWLDPISATATVTPFMINVGSFDNCGIAIMLIDGASSKIFTISDVGANLVMLTTIDINGNVSNCVATVTVWFSGTYANVSGRIAIDSNSNCIPEALETGSGGNIVQFQKANQTVFFNTNTSGNYTGVLDTGTYTVSLIPPSLYWEACPTTQQIVVDTNYFPQVVDWSIEQTVQCPALTVDISAPFIRLNGASQYAVSYCNNGTVPAQNAYVEVELDPSLYYTYSNEPLPGQSGNTLTFNIGNIAVGQCGTFFIYVQAQVGVYIGQTHCTEARIYPDSTCIPNLWNGAAIDVTAQCLNDSITFYITNNGANMSGSRSYYVYEDSTMIQPGAFFINAGGVASVVIAAAPGKTYRLTAEQEPGFPAILGDATATVFVENCNVVSFPNMSRGFGTNFSNGNSSPSIAIDCRQNIAAFDPNDKTAQPVGYGTEHYIHEAVPIDYQIRFQNTGTDTAFDVVVLDTLSPFLNVGTIEMGASSHAYEWQLLEGNVLQVSFNNIMLPDSNVNELESHGFFKFRIQQMAQNSIGTLIENSAAIYFDVNPPIITNTIFHTIGDDFVNVVVAVEETATNPPGMDFQLFPNPMQGAAPTLGIALSETTGSVNVSIHNALGQVLQSGTYQAQNRISIDFDFEATPGIYFVMLKNEKGEVGVKKLTISR